MESYTTMTINFNNSEAATKAMNIIKAALKTINFQQSSQHLKKILL